MSKSSKRPPASGPPARGQKIHCPHDGMFQAVFSDPRQASDYFRHHLPTGMKDRIDLESLRHVPGTFIDSTLGRRYSDLLFEAELRGQPPPVPRSRKKPSGKGRRGALLYILFEHRSTSEPLMLFRLYRYMSRIWEVWLRNHPGETRLPPILPVVLYHGRERWTGHSRFSELYAIHPEDREQLAPHLPDFQLILHDLSGVPDEQLSGEALVQLTLLLFKHIRSKDLMSFLHRWTDLFLQVYRSSGWEWLKLVLSYVFEAGESVVQEELSDLVEEVVQDRRKAEEEVMTLAEKWKKEGKKEGIKEGKKEGIKEGKKEGIKEGKKEGIQEGKKEGIKEGKKEGIQEGKKEGIQEGKKEGESSLLLMLLQSRFHEVPEPLQRQISQAPLGDIELWSVRMLTAGSLAEVFEEA